MSVSHTSVAQNLAQVHSRMSAAASSVGRDPSSIRLVVVCKGQPVSRILEAYDAGQRDFAESRVEEGLARQTQMAPLQEVCWHLVGHIQGRKAKLVPGSFAWVHSVDRLKVARLLSQGASEIDVRLSVLLECNVSGESTKGGWTFGEQGIDEFLAEAAEVKALPNLQVRGLMTMAPWTSDPESIRWVFRRLRELRDALDERLPGSWSELSMGMSDDFEAAIQEGATIVRLGRAIFGERPMDAVRPTELAASSSDPLPVRERG